jgi:hypothetical protein
VTWPGLFGAFVVCHLTSDFLLQTDWQASHKQGRLARDRVARRANVVRLGVDQSLHGLALGVVALLGSS